MTVADWRAHRIGLTALRFPRITLVLLAVVTILAVFGASRLTIDPSLTRLFHGQTKEFAKFERLLKAVPTAEQNVLVLVSGERLFDRKILKTLKNLHLELRLVEPVRSVSSIFNVRQPLSGKSLPPPIFPERIPSTSELPALEAALKSNPLVSRRLFASGGGAQHAIFSVSLDPTPNFASVRDQSLGEINSIASKMLKPVGLQWEVGGVPQARFEMLRGIQHDFLFFNSAGFALGTLICAMLLRNARLVVLAGLCPLIGAIVGAGLMGAMGVKLSPLMTAIPLLVMAITFTDAMHLLHSIQASMKKRQSVARSVKVAVVEVGPACVLASVTTALALLSLTLSGSPMVSAFGAWACVANLAGVLVLLTLLPALAVLSLRNASRERNTSSQSSEKSPTRLEDFCVWIGNVTLRRHRFVIVLGVLVTIVLTLIYAQLSPKYRLSDQLPADSGFRRVNVTLDAHFAGSNQIAVLIEPRESASSSIVRLLDAVREVHARFGSINGLSAPLSIFSLLGEMPTESWPSSDVFRQQLLVIPQGKTDGLLNRSDRLATLLLNVRDLEAEQITRLADKLQDQLHLVRQTFPDLRFTVTGMPVLLAKEAPKIVTQINTALLVALVIVFAVIGLAFRSLKTALISIIPNVLPIVSAGSLIYFVVGGLDYASVIGLTVAFGLAVDDSIHFLNRFQVLTMGRAPTIEALSETLRSTGPVLIATTIILFCTLAITVFGSIPPTRVFGQTCAAMLIAALLADLVILPALVRGIYLKD